MVGLGGTTNHEPLVLGAQAPSYQLLPMVSQLEHIKEEKQQLDAMPCGWGWQD